MLLRLHGVAYGPMQLLSAVLQHIRWAAEWHRPGAMQSVASAAPEPGPHQDCKHGAPRTTDRQKKGHTTVGNPALTTVCTRW